MAYELMKAWVESDTEHPVPGEIVSLVVIRPVSVFYQHGSSADIPHVPAAVDACLFVRLIEMSRPHHSYYELLGPSGEIYQVNVTSDTMPRVFICRYGNAAKAFSLDFQKRSVLWSPV